MFKYKRIIAFMMRNIVLVTAIFAALVTSFIITPDKTYLTYFDFKTLTCLFCVLAVVCAFKNINFFYTVERVFGSSQDDCIKTENREG